MEKFFDKNPYIGFLRRFFFLRLKAGIDRTILGEFTNGDEFIIFRVFAAKKNFAIFCQKNRFFEKLKNKLYINTFEVFLWQNIFFENDHVRWKWHFSSLTASIAFKRISIGQWLRRNGDKNFHFAFRHEKTTKSYRSSAIFMKKYPFNLELSLK